MGEHQDEGAGDAKGEERSGFNPNRAGAGGLTPLAASAPHEDGPDDPRLRGARDALDATDQGEDVTPVEPGGTERFRHAGPDGAAAVDPDAEPAEEPSGAPSGLRRDPARGAED